MKNRLILICLFILASCGQAASKGEAAPEFALPHVTQTDIAKLSDYKGQVVYLDFWASWCKPCVESFPKLESLHLKYKDQGFNIIAINLDQKVELAKSFLNAHPVSYTVLYDKGANVAGQYGVSAMPSSFFIDKKGTVRLAHQGFSPGDEVKIEKAIQLLLAE